MVGTADLQKPPPQERDSLSAQPRPPAPALCPFPPLTVQEKEPKLAILCPYFTCFQKHLGISPRSSNLPHILHPDAGALHLKSLDKAGFLSNTPGYRVSGAYLGQALYGFAHSSQLPCEAQMALSPSLQMRTMKAGTNLSQVT